MNAGNDLRSSLRGKRILVLLWIFGFSGALSVFVLGVLDQFATGRITDIFGVEVPKTFASNIISLDVMRLHEFGTSIGRMLQNFIIWSFGVGPNTARGWPLVALTLGVCILVGGVLSALGRFILKVIGLQSKFC